MVEFFSFKRYPTITEALEAGPKHVEVLRAEGMTAVEECQMHVQVSFLPHEAKWQFHVSADIKKPTK